MREDSWYGSPSIFTKALALTASLLLCLGVVSFAGCSGEQGTAYKKAESELNRRSDNAKYKNAAVLFESAGDFKDAATRSRACWVEYGAFLLRRGQDIRQKSFAELQKTLADLQEAKTVFTHIHDEKRMASSDDSIKTVQAWIAVQAELEKGNDAKAVALLETMDPKDNEVREILERTRTRGERLKRLAPLREYLERIPHPSFSLDENQPLHANLDRLFATAHFKNNQREKIAEVLAALRCYGSIAHALNNMLGYNNMRKLSYMDVPLKTRLTKDTLLLAVLLLSEAGDESSEFAELLTLLRGIVISPAYRADHKDTFRRCATLLELYKAGPEWVDTIFPGNADLKDCTIPGTLEYRVLHAPKRITDVLYNETADVLPERFIRNFSPQEAAKWFANFVPTEPLKTGFIVVVDQGTPPANASVHIVRNRPYESAYTYAVASYERKHTEDSSYDALQRKKVSRTLSPLVEERIPQKGDYFCVANPNNARLAIYETHSYSRHGSYQVSGRQDMVDVYLPAIDIAVVDLVSRKTLFTDHIRLDAKQKYNIPATMKQGDVFIPALSPPGQEYLKEKLHSALK